jgi:hypothetical protein
MAAGEAPDLQDGQLKTLHQITVAEDRETVKYDRNSIKYRGEFKTPIGGPDFWGVAEKGLRHGPC